MIPPLKRTIKATLMLSIGLLLASEARAQLREGYPGQGSFSLKIVVTVINIEAQEPGSIRQTVTAKGTEISGKANAEYRQSLYDASRSKLEPNKLRRLNDLLQKTSLTTTEDKEMLELLWAADLQGSEVETDLGGKNLAASIGNGRIDIVGPIEILVFDPKRSIPSGRRIQHDPRFVVVNSATVIHRLEGGTLGPRIKP